MKKLILFALMICGAQHALAQVYNFFPPPPMLYNPGPPAVLSTNGGGVGLELVTGVVTLDIDNNGWAFQDSTVTQQYFSGANAVTQITCMRANPCGVWQFPTSANARAVLSYGIETSNETGYFQCTHSTSTLDTRGGVTWTPGGTTSIGPPPNPVPLAVTTVALNNSPTVSGCVFGNMTGAVELSAGGTNGVSYLLEADTNSNNGHLQIAVGDATHAAIKGITLDNATNVLTANFGSNGAAGDVTNILGGSVANTQANGVPIMSGFTATSASIGGGALGAGACASTTTAVTGATTGMVTISSPAGGTDPGTGFYWQSFVSSANTVTTRICAAVAGTPTATTYNIRVLL